MLTKIVSASLFSFFVNSLAHADIAKQLRWTYVGQQCGPTLGSWLPQNPSTRPYTVSTDCRLTGEQTPLGISCNVAGQKCYGPSYLDPSYKCVDPNTGTSENTGAYIFNIFECR